MITWQSNDSYTTYRSNVCSVLWSTDSHLWKHKHTEQVFGFVWHTNGNDVPPSSLPLPPLSLSHPLYIRHTIFSHSWSSSQWKGNTAYSQLLSTPASKWTQDKVFISSLDSENDNIGQVNKDEKMKAWKWGWYLDWEWGWYLDWEWGWYLEPGNEADTWTELMLKAISSAVWTSSVKMSLSEQ